VSSIIIKSVKLDYLSSYFIVSLIYDICEILTQVYRFEYYLEESQENPNVFQHELASF